MFRSQLPQLQTAEHDTQSITSRRTINPVSYIPQNIKRWTHILKHGAHARDGDRLGSCCMFITWGNATAIALTENFNTVARLATYSPRVPKPYCINKL